MQDLNPSEVEAILKGIGQTATESAPIDKSNPLPSSKISRIQLGQLQAADTSDNPITLQAGLQEVKLKADVVLGRSNMTLQQLLDLKEGQLISLDKLAGEPIEIEIHGRLIAYGEIVAIDDHYGIHITQIL